MTVAEIKKETQAHKQASATSEALCLFDMGYNKDAVALKLLRGGYGFRSKAEAMDCLTTALYHRIMKKKKAYRDVQCPSVTQTQPLDMRERFMETLGRW